jgi:D-alanine-D-alanine ligase-like ATP-grasp enzyme
MKTVAYSMEAAKEDLVLKQGFFQLLGVDIIFDDEFNAYLIEFNTSAGLYTELPPHRWVVP